MKSQQEIQQLETVESQGLRARFSHWRYLTKDGQMHLMSVPRDYREQGFSIEPKGGITRVKIEDENQRMVAYADALCSNLDNYNRRVGRMIALGRALRRHKAHQLPTAIHENSDNSIADRVEAMEQKLDAILNLLS